MEFFYHFADVPPIDSDRMSVRASVAIKTTMTACKGEEIDSCQDMFRYAESAGRVVVSSESDFAVL